MVQLLLGGALALSLIVARTRYELFTAADGSADAVPAQRVPGAASQPRYRAHLLDVSDPSTRLERRTRPGRAPVCLPSLTTKIPLTSTWGMPSAYA